MLLRCSGEREQTRRKERTACRSCGCSRADRGAGRDGSLARRDADSAWSWSLERDLARPLNELPDPLEVPVLLDSKHQPFIVSVRPPGSKSLTNRALLLAALAEGESLLRHPLLGAEDTERMMAALEILGADVEVSSTGHLQVHGVGGRWRLPVEGVVLNLHNAGTATRFLAAAALLADAPITIDGNARMRERPIGELIEALEVLGADVNYLGTRGCPPVQIFMPEEIEPAPRVELATTMSSQFISALLLIAPFVPGGMTLNLTGELTSRSYVEMTLGLLDELGAVVKTSGDLRVIRICPPSRLGPGMPGFELEIEPDASSATYFWGAAALIPGATCTVRGLHVPSLQPDAGFPELLARMGAVVGHVEGQRAVSVQGSARLGPIDADLSLMPDAAMTLAAVACFAEGRSVLRGLRTLRHKETDRIEALRNELSRIGVDVGVDEAGDRDSMTITPPEGGVSVSSSAPRVEFETYDDHRMAMALSLIGLRRPNTFVRNPGCVAKTYPGYWTELARLYR